MRALVLGLGVALFGPASGAPASSGGDFAIVRDTLDAGGGRGSGAGFVLDGTLGQPDAGPASGGGYSLRGGFWRAGSETGAPARIFGDGFEAG